MTTGRDKSSLPERDHSREGRAQAMLGQTANDQGKTVAIYITLCPACSRAHPGGSAFRPGRHDPSSARYRPRSALGGARLAEQPAEPAPGCVARTDKALWGGRELRTPYLHQLPPVLPKNSFFSEFQMNFFQLPSSLAFPRAMVAGQRLPRGLRVGECGARPRVLPGCWLAAPARFSAGCTRRCRCGSPSARRALEGQRQEREEGEAAAGAEGGGRGRAGWAAPSPAPIGGRTAARGRSLVRHALLWPLGVWGSRRRSCCSGCHWVRVLGPRLL